MLCKYKDIFGKPNEGAHSKRLLNLAMVDLIATIVVGYILSFVFNCNPIYSIIGLIIVGIISHRLFCVRTTIDKLLFPKSGTNLN